VIGDRLAAIELLRKQRIADRLGSLVERGKRPLERFVVRGFEDRAMEMAIGLQVPATRCRAVPAVRAGGKSAR
jgi:hypothetical protein